MALCTAACHELPRYPHSRVHLATPIAPPPGARCQPTAAAGALFGGYASPVQRLPALGRTRHRVGARRGEELAADKAEPPLLALARAPCPGRASLAGRVDRRPRAGSIEPTAWPQHVPAVRARDWFGGGRAGHVISFPETGLSTPICDKTFARSQRLSVTLAGKGKAPG